MNNNYYRYYQGGNGSTLPITPFVCFVQNTQLYINPGVVNQLIPINMFTGTVPLFDIPTGRSLNLVKIQCNSDGHNINNVAILIDGIQPTGNSNLGAPPLGYSVVLGAILTSGSNIAFYQINSGNVDIIPRQAFLAPKATITPGLEPFDRYWTWYSVFHTP